MHAIWSLWSVVKSLLPMLILRTVSLLQKPEYDDSCISLSALQISRVSSLTERGSKQMQTDANAVRFDHCCSCMLVLIGVQRIQCILFQAFCCDFHTY